MQVAQLHQHAQGLARPLQLAGHLEVRNISTCLHYGLWLPVSRQSRRIGDEANPSAQVLQDFTLSSSGEYSCDLFHPAKPQPSSMDQLNVAAIVAQAQHLQGWCAQLELQLQGKDIGASSVASPPA